MYTLDVLSPVAASMGEAGAKGAATRPRSLDGLVIGLLWNSKRGGEIALERAGALMASRFRDVRVIRYDGSMPCDQQLLGRAREECDVFVGATAD